MVSNYAGLRAQALPLAVPLAATAMGGLLTDTVASSQMFALAGPGSLSLVFALSGVALALAALMQFTTMDRRPRLLPLRIIGFTYAGASTLALILLLLGIAPVPMTVIVWLLGIAVVGIPEYTVEDSARHASMTVVPDSMRARITLIIDLCRFADAQVFAALLALVGTSLGRPWISGIMVKLVAVLAWCFGRRVKADWGRHFA